MGPGSGRRCGLPGGGRIPLEFSVYKSLPLCIEKSLTKISPAVIWHMSVLDV